jgi:hypothetical protein
MIFTVDGKYHEKQAWLQRLVGSPTDDSYRLLDSCELEGHILYANTISGAVLALGVPSLSLGCQIPARAWDSLIEAFRQAIIFWDQEIQAKPVEVLEKVEDGLVLGKYSAGAGAYGHIGLGDLPSTKRSFVRYQEMQARRQRKEWLPKEMPLCPECLALESGYAAKDRDFCVRHRWLNESVYHGWGIQFTPSGLHIGGPLKTRILKLEKPVEELPQRKIIAPEPDRAIDFTWGHSRPAPSEFTDLEQLRAFGNHELEIYNVACRVFDREAHRYSEDLRAWGDKCLLESKDYINQLRQRMVELDPTRSPVVLQVEDEPGIQFNKGNDIHSTISPEEVKRLEALLDSPAGKVESLRTKILAQLELAK